MQLFVVGLSHRTAPVAVRERVAIDPAELETRLRQVVALPGVREVAIVSTCNRVEIYGAFSDVDLAVTSLRAELLEALADPKRGPGSGADDVTADVLFSRHIYTRVRHEALHHLFRVAASLDSLVIGEPQILGQVKEAFDLAEKIGTAGPVLGSVFSRAFRVARKVRRDTAIASQRVSVASVAVDLARQVWGGFAGRRVLLIGAGEMADLAARVLKRDGATLAVCNRTRARAEELAGRLEAEVENWESLKEALSRADIVISSTGAREPVLRRPLLAEVQRGRRGRELVIIDIAVPRDVESSVGTLNGVFLYDIDDLQKIVGQNLEDRRSEGDRAEALIEAEIARFVATDRGRAAGPTIAALRTRAVGLARAEVERTLGGLAGADERTKRAIGAMADAIVAKILHAPSVALKKEAGGSGDGPSLVEAAHRLFDLPPLQPVVEVDADDPGEDLGQRDRTESGLGPSLAPAEVSGVAELAEIEKVSKKVSRS
jgi:glutamyl-tRNA reductase